LQAYKTIDGVTSIDVIVSTAVRLILDQGLARFSMRKLADVLNIGVMTLYNYVRNKEDLFDQIIVQLLGQIGPQDPGDWRSRLIRSMDRLHDVLTAYPFIGSLTLERRRAISGLDILREQILRAFFEAGLPREEAAKAATILIAYVSGYTLIENSRRGESGAVEARRLSTLSPVDFPLLSASADVYVDHASREVFDVGLESLIDGLVTHGTVKSD
jgi:AcrR family transcriptional regulator